MFCKLDKEKLPFVAILPFMLYMPNSTQFVQEIDKQGPIIHLSQAKLAISEISFFSSELEATGKRDLFGALCQNLA